MKMCFFNSRFLNRFNSLLALTILCLFTSTSCKCKRGCEGLDAMTEQYIPSEVQAILDFPEDTIWIFECVSTHDRDTLILRDTLQILPLEKGDCAVSDKGKCCSEFYNQKSKRKIEVHSTSGFNHFTNYYTDEDALGMKGDWGTISIMNHIYSNNFPLEFADTLALTIADTVLYDTRSGQRNIKVIDPSTPFLVSWSKANGLVKYTYITATDTIKYERINFHP